MNDGLYAFNPDGSIIWEIRADGDSTLHSSPAITADGSVVLPMIAGVGATLWNVSSEGELLWQTHLDPAPHIEMTSPALDADGNIYIGAETGNTGPGEMGWLFAVSPEGHVLWSYEVPQRPIRSSPVVGPDGTIYVGTKSSETINAELLALNPDGSLRWSWTLVTTYGTPFDIYSPPTIGADGTLYFGNEGYALTALSGDGEFLWNITADPPVGNHACAPALMPDGTLYISTANEDELGPERGNLIAVTTESMGLADSPWPRFLRNNQNTGRP